MRENQEVPRTSLCPILVRRDDELGVLEDALLAARRGESRFVVLAGEAGIGKTRLSRELAREARELGCAVLSGGAADAEVALPYLPFVEAIGNYLDEQDLDRLREALGPALGELGQLFPSLAGDRLPEPSADSGQAKLRLFEAIASLLALPARDRTLLLVIEDVHWADASTRELLDYLARRLTDLPSLIVVTYRADELHRRHPFLPTLQGWRRSGVADIVELEPLSEDGIGEMLAAILGPDDVDPELHELMLERTEGNPFVLEEMLREVVEGSASPEGLKPDAVARTRLPESVRQAILLRVQRLGDERAAVLEAAAALGRTFDHGTLLEVSGQPESTVHDALEAATAQQLLEEDPTRPGRYSWRHALTQEAIYAETVTPRRQAIHSRAADVLAASQGTRAVDLANHLLGAARFEEAVPVCLRSAEEAESALAFGEAVSLLERAIPYVNDPVEKARLLCRIGRNEQRNGRPAAGIGYLASGIEELDAHGEQLEAARYRIVLGRCHWECERPDAARAEYERALELLEPAGPSADLAMVHQRLAGLSAFQLDYLGCLESAQRAVEIAEQVGADLERVWALVFLALGYVDGSEQARGFALMETCFEEARAKGYSQIASNVAWNNIWTRTHMLLSELEEWLERLESLPYYGQFGPRSGDTLCRCYIATVRGDLEAALDAAEAAVRHHGRLGFGKMEWRARIHTAQILAELGRYEEAEKVLPPKSTRTELQDIVYDAAARIRTAAGLERTDEVLAVAEEIRDNAERLSTYREPLALAAEVLAAAGRRSDVEHLAEAGRAHPTEAGAAYLDQIEGLLALLSGDHQKAAASFDVIVDAASEAGYPLVEMRARILRARAWSGAVRNEDVVAELRSIVEEADRLGARLLAREGREAAAELGIEVPPAPEDAQPEARSRAVLPQGERLVTSLFADVRGYSALGSSLAPGALAERVAMLYRLARVAVERRQGIIDKFAGDAVMATFNVSGTSTEHTIDAVEAALALRDRAATIELPLGIGISVGPGVVGRGVSDDNIAVTGEATNLAARLQAQAGPGEILLSAEAQRRVAEWLDARGMETTREELELKGFAEPQVVHRLAAGDRAAVA
jgi:class 3 adenylate cyclase/tetratricopeptide (TPR) repeat protein